MMIEAMIATLREMHAAYSIAHPPHHVASGDLVMPHSWAGSSVPWAMVLEIGHPPHTPQIVTDLRSLGSQHFGMHQDMRIAAHVDSDQFACFWVESWEWQRVTEDQLLASVEKDNHNAQ